MTVQPGTPLPWVIATTGNSYNENRTSWREIIREGDEGEFDTLIGEVYCRTSDESQPDDAEAALNAAYIDVACNSFPELVAALEAIASGQGIGGPDAELQCADIARKALSALKVGRG